MAKPVKKKQPSKKGPIVVGSWDDVISASVSNVGKKPAPKKKGKK